jgi:hypothetical protein
MRPFKIIIIFILLIQSIIFCKKVDVSQELSNLKISASSSLKQLESPWEHDPVFLFDNNNKTIWCADGSTGTISITLDLPIEFKLLKIINGRALNSKSLAENSQVSKLKISSYYKDKESQSLIVPISENKFDSKGNPVSQSIELEKTLTGEKFEFEILETIEGKSSKNVCITSLQIGTSKDKNETIYPISNLEEIKKYISQLSNGKRHNLAFHTLKKFTSLEDKRSSIFCNFNRCIYLFLNSDGTFLMEKKPNIESTIDTENEEFQTDLQQKDPYFAFKNSTGSYKLNKITGSEGVEINFRFFDEEGNEQNEFWYLKNLRKDDKEYDDFKTLMGANFKEFDQKSFHLFHLKSTKENGYHGKLGDLDFFSKNIPIKIE